ncbi:MAG: DUF2520 domain-containing protein [Acholeplasmatales bacterium]|nr:DUF2520 domain-containing protein [Acholeplasmatales bacterium]
MKIGFIGAGKVGYSLSKWFNTRYNNVCGIYSKNWEDAKDCCEFVISEYYKNMNELICDCDTLFLTVNDDSLSEVVDELIKLKLKNKKLIHTSGSLTTDIFKELNNDNYCYSIHPIYAFNDKYNSYKGLNDIYFTLEGCDKYLDELNELFNSRIKIIKKENKEKYHLACSMISNMVCGIVNISENIFKEIGLDDKDIYMPLFMNNANNINNYGSLKALTGPILRNDINTVKKHINNLDKNELMIYKYLGLYLVGMAKDINKDNDYEKLESLLEEI